MEHPDADVEGHQGVQVLEGDVVGYGRVACQLGVKTCETMRLREELQNRQLGVCRRVV